MRTVASFVLALSLVACSSSSPKKNPDAPVIDDAPIDARVCGALTTGPQTFLGYDAQNMAITWFSDIPGGIGDGNPMTLQYEFYQGVEPSLMGTFDLSTGNQANYMTCAICLHAYTQDSMGNPLKHFFQSAGSITLTEDPFTNQHMIGSISNLQLQEVTVAMDYTSTPVPGGACSSDATLTLDKDAVPDAWTCPHAKYRDGTTCDCSCGAQDPDCDVDANSVVGCSAAGDRCFAGTCTTPPLNDTCATATPVLLATPLTGTTKGASHSYNMGLEGTTCTGVTQAGPDVAYSITLTAATAYTVTLTGLDAGYDGSVAIVGPGASTVCDANQITTCVAGADVGAEGENETVSYTPTATGNYYIIVDSFYAEEAGNFTLTVTSP
jgi:hypothetical protein